MEETQDIIALLKAKERQMEELLEKARKEARSIKDDTAARAAKVREEASAGIEVDAEGLRAAEASRLALELRRLEERGRADVDALAERARSRMDEAVRLVFEVLTCRTAEMERRRAEAQESR